MKQRELAVQMKNISKHFGGIKALDNVDMELYKGEVLAIVGDNGAGKSTLIKTLTGDVLKDSGEIIVNSKKANIRHPDDSIKLGIEAIYQDFALIGTFDLQSNLFLGKEKTTKRFGIPLLDKKTMMKESLEVVEGKIGIKIENIYNNVFTLSGGQQQAIAIGRAIYTNAKVLIMDEPTASIGVEGIAKLINLIEKLKDQEMSIIIISHNLEHIFAVADRILVLRLGKVAGVVEKNKTNKSEIISLIVGG